MPTPAQRRRKWLYDDEEFVRGRIWALEDAAVQTLGRHFVQTRDRLYGELGTLWGRYVEGDHWSASDLRYRERTDALLAQVESELSNLMAAAQGTALEASIAAYQGGYVGRAWVLENGLHGGVNMNIPLLPVPAIRAAILAPYRGLTFVDRFADQRDEFVRRVRRSMVESQINGDTIYQAQKRLAQELGIDIGRRTKAARAANRAMFARTEMIARTEILRASNLGAMQVYLDNQDVLSGWQWLLTHDERTCAVCIGRNANNKVYTFEERETPPAHPRCRCSVVPMLGEAALNAPIVGQRRPFADWVLTAGVIEIVRWMTVLRGKPAPKSPSDVAVATAPGLF